jgi:hypothetical protein
MSRFDLRPPDDQQRVRIAAGLNADERRGTRFENYWALD